MGILLVYDVTDEASFNNVRNWMKNIETHASSTVNKVGLHLMWGRPLKTSVRVDGLAQMESSPPVWQPFPCW